MKLIELIRMCIERNFQYLSIDFDGQVYGSESKPTPNQYRWISTGATMFFIGEYELTCDWTNAIIDISQLRGVA